MDSNSFQNPFVQKIRMLTHLLLLSLCVNIALGATLVYHFTMSSSSKALLAKELPEVKVRKEHSDFLKTFFQMTFEELVLELSNMQEIADGYKVRDLSLAILTNYHYLDLAKALMGESLEEREVMFIHTEGGELFPLSLYPNIHDYHYALIKGYIKECKYPWTAEGVFSELKMKGCDAPADLMASFMLSKEFIAIYTFVYRFNDAAEKEKLLSMMLKGRYQDVERFYYLYLENMDRQDDMMRHFLKTYCKYKSSYAADMWVNIDAEFILHQLDNSDLSAVIELTGNQDFLRKVQLSIRGEEVRVMAKSRAIIPVIEEVLATGGEDLQEEKAPAYQKPNLYIVKSGDSLWKIAHAHHVTIKEIRHVNDLKSDMLKPGQTITLPLK